jgi:predicted alpha/beta superfamily hydrolase
MVEVWDVTIPSLTGDESRKAYIYLPTTYEEDEDRRYPVLYMFDGQNVFFDSEATYGKSWGMEEYLDYTQTQLIVAAVASNQHPDNSRLNEYSPYSFNDSRFGKVTGKGKKTMDWFVYDFKSEIDRAFRTLPDRGNTFIAGSSMGGLMSLYALMKYNKFFSAAAALSPSLWVDTEKIQRLIYTSRLRKNTVLYMDYGSQEFKNHPHMLEKFSAVTSSLMEKQVMVSSRIVPGGNHSEASWEKQVPFFIDTLLYQR